MNSRKEQREVQMFKRQTRGSTVCRSCGKLVGVNDNKCYNCGASNPGLWGYSKLIRGISYGMDFAKVVIVSCGVLYVLTLLSDISGIRMGGGLSLLAPSVEGLFTFGASGYVPVFSYGRWWTLLSAGWLHGGLLHIAFNMLWVRQLAPVTGQIYGVSRLVIIYTVSSASGFLLSSLAGVPLTIGASAPLFGLFGALVWAGRKTGSSALGRQAMMYAVILFAFGLFMPGIDNFAHFGGFAGGLGASYLLNPLKREGQRDFLLALFCLAATLASVLLSIVTV